MSRRSGGARRPGLGVSALLVGLVVLGACAPAEPPGSTMVADPTTWAATVGRTVDDTTLADRGLEIPEGASVLAARIFPGGAAPAYTFYRAGGGGFSDRFYPASAVKLLAALGALDFARTRGVSGEAVVDDGYSLREIYDAALRWSSNEDYDELVRIAGVDWLNRRYLPSTGTWRRPSRSPTGAGTSRSPTHRRWS